MRLSRGAFPARADLRLLALVGLAHLTEELQRLSRLFLVEAVEREASPTCASPSSRAQETIRRTPPISALAVLARGSTISTIWAGIPKHMSYRAIAYAAIAAWPKEMQASLGGSKE
jgi:hypothetical protein